MIKNFNSIKLYIILERSDYSKKNLVQQVSHIK